MAARATKPARDSHSNCRVRTTFSPSRSADLRFVFEMSMLIPCTYRRVARRNADGSGVGQVDAVERDETVSALALAGAPPERDAGGALVELELAEGVLEGLGRV